MVCKRIWKFWFGGNSPTQKPIPTAPGAVSNEAPKPKERIISITLRGVMGFEAIPGTTRATLSCRISIDGVSGKDVSMKGEITGPADFKKSFDKILTLSQASKKDLEKLGISVNSVQLYIYWINQKIFKKLDKNQCRKNLGLGPNFIVLFVGRLIDIKGTDILIQVAKEVNKKHFDAALNKIKPSVTKVTIESYKRIEEDFLKSAKAAIPFTESYLG